MNETVKKVMVGALHWAFAASIAGSIAWFVVVDRLEKHDRGIDDCSSSVCYIEHEKRITQIEVAMQCPNNNCDRFKGKDAREMEERINMRIDAINKGGIHAKR